VTAVQGPPVPGRSYRGMPRHHARATSTMYRAHHVSRGAWWFDSSRSGRFNLRAPLGTCYAATKMETAVREKVRDEVAESGVVSRALAESFVVSILDAPVDFTCASVSSAGAVRHGLVRELVTMDDYAVPQEWAEVLHANMFDGIYYASAYTTGGPTALALFGDRGAPGSGFAAERHRTGADACAAAGLTVAGPPAVRSLTII